MSDARKMFRRPEKNAYFLKVDYREFQPETYRGIVLERAVKGLTTEILRIDTGDFERDMSEMETRIPSLVKGMEVFTDSSVLHFRQDVEAKRFAEEHPASAE